MAESMKSFDIEASPSNVEETQSTAFSTPITSTKGSRKVHSLCNLPNTINGVALGSAGTAVMLKNIGHMYSLTRYTKWPFYLFLFWSALLMLTYIIKVVLYCTHTIKTDFVQPCTVARSGVYLMSWFLIASVLSSELIGFPIIVSQVMIITAEAFQLVAMSFFLIVCYRTKTLPEPFYNAGVLSIIFPAITLPGNVRSSKFCIKLLSTLITKWSNWAALCQFL